MMVAFLSKSTQNGNNIQRSTRRLPGGGAKVHRTQPCLQLQLYALQCTFAVPAATTTATALAAFSHKHIYANVHKYSIISMSTSFSPPPSPTLALALSTGCHCEFLDSSSESVAALLHLISLWPQVNRAAYAIVFAISSSYHRHRRHSGFTFKVFRIFCAP